MTLAQFSIWISQKTSLALQSMKFHQLTSIKASRYSLDVTVAHESSTNNKYIHHLSNDNAHDLDFTVKVAKDVIDLYTGGIHQVIRFKSDNCVVQYKSKRVFGFWRNLAKELDRTIIVYYGGAGHSKGLVDAASGFGVKDPIRKAIIVEDWFFNSANNIVTYLDQKKESANKSMRSYQLKLYQKCAMRINQMSPSNDQENFIA